MKIAVPTSEGKLSTHFGHCETFTIVDIDDNDNSVKATEELVPPPHEPGVLPNWLSSQGCHVIIAGGMGHRAISMFESRGIKVVLGAPVEQPESLVTSYLAGKLESGDNACDSDHSGGHEGCGQH